MQVRLQFLGTGASMGVPIIGCNCEVCTSTSAYNKRFRSSALLTIGTKKFLLDVGPDFRMQALRNGITSLDGIFLTHLHFDHIGGIDDLRIFYFRSKAKIPCVLSKETYAELQMRYYYLLHPMVDDFPVSAQVDFRILENDFGKIDFEGISLRYVTFFQKETKVTGFIFGKLAYISDIREYTDELIRALEGIDTLVISALRPLPTSMHFSIDEAIHFAQKVGARRTYFTHISHEIEHKKISQTLPPDIHLAYDGLEIECLG